jgi:hypothetical protein
MNPSKDLAQLGVPVPSRPCGTYRRSHLFTCEQMWTRMGCLPSCLKKSESEPGETPIEKRRHQSQTHPEDLWRSWSRRVLLLPQPCLLKRGEGWRGQVLCESGEKLSTWRFYLLKANAWVCLSVSWALGLCEFVSGPSGWGGLWDIAPPGGKSLSE